MRVKTPSAAWLLLIVLGSSGAAGPPPDCSSEGGSGPTLPVPLDLAGRPSLPSGLAGHSFATPPNVNGGTLCHGRVPSVANTPIFHDDLGDALHGLPAPDLLRPMDEPKQAPMFQ